MLRIQLNLQTKANLPPLIRKTQLILFTKKAFLLNNRKAFFKRMIQLFETYTVTKNKNLRSEAYKE